MRSLQCDSIFICMYMLFHICVDFDLWSFNSKITYSCSGTHTYKCLLLSEMFYWCTTYWDQGKEGNTEMGSRPPISATTQTQEFLLDTGHLKGGLMHGKCQDVCVTGRTYEHEKLDLYKGQNWPFVEHAYNKGPGHTYGKGLAKLCSSKNHISLIRKPLTLKMFPQMFGLKDRHPFTLHE